MVECNITSASRQFLGAFWLKRGRLMYQLRRISDSD